MNTSGKGTVLRLVGIGWYVAICITGGVIGGFLLDELLDISPVLTLLGLGLGLALAIFGMYRMLMAVLAASAGTDDQGTP